jgi:DNA-binding protein HU-beta
MTKAEIVAKLAEEIKISKTAAGKALALITDSIAQAMRKGEKVTFVGFGTFSVVQRKARKGRNPQPARRSRSPRRRLPSSPQDQRSKQQPKERHLPRNPRQRRHLPRRRKRNRQDWADLSRPALPPLRSPYNTPPSCVPFKTDVVASAPVITDVPTIATRSIERGDAENPEA